MTTKKLLSLQLKRLLSSVAAHGNQHLTEIEADLVQTNFLLVGAIEKLGESFMSIHAAASAQQEAVAMKLAGKSLTDEQAGRLSAASTEIELHVNAAVTALQFQDMTAQLIGRALQRVAGLTAVLKTLEVSSGEMTGSTDIEEIVALLNNVNRLLEEQSGKLESDLWRAVCQTHMESGDVELF
jgi:hypothetical protein